MIKSTLRGATRRFPRSLFIVALVGVMTIPNIISAVADTSNKTVNTLAAPCAVFDSRSWDLDGDTNTDDAPSANTEYDFYITADSEDASAAYSMEQQGGVAGGCNVPSSAGAVLLNIVSVFPTGDGNLKAASLDGATAAQGGVLVYDNSQDIGIGNMIVVELHEDADTSTPEMSVYINGAQTHIRGVVMGWLDDAPAA